MVIRVQLGFLGRKNNIAFSRLVSLVDFLIDVAVVHPESIAFICCCAVWMFTGLPSSLMGVISLFLSTFNVLPYISMHASKV